MHHSSEESGRDVGENLIAGTLVCPATQNAPNVGRPRCDVGGCFRQHLSDRPLDKIFGDIPARFPGLPRFSDALP
jgi:hypothetical protein